ncbi:MAG: biopolymer transporter ExbD [Sneathiellaceae bacterium]
MSRLTRSRAGGGSLNGDAGVLPLINVVFLLLIFFMISGQIAEQAAFEVDPPTSQADAQAMRDRMLVLLAADGRAAVGGEEIALEEIVAHILAVARKAAEADRVEANAGAAAGGVPDGPPALPADLAVRIRADAAVEAVAIVKLIEDLRAAGVGKVTLMTAGQS